MRMNLSLEVEPIMYKENMGCPLPPFSVSQTGKAIQALTMSDKNRSYMLGCMPG